jgi:Uma2 family endonuclease
MTRGLKTRLDYDDLAHVPDDGQRYELLDGELHVTPSPSPAHQRVSKRLQRQLEDYFEGRGLGEVFAAPLDVILSFHDVVEPDLIVVTDPGQISRRAIEGPPALAVEILSPTSESRDRGVKALRYASLGVAHYWIVDIEAKTVECFQADEASYRLVASAARDERLSHPAWPDLAVDLAALWR